MVNPVLQTLIDTELEHRQNGDTQLKYIDKDQREFKALIALNIMATKIATSTYRVDYLSDVIGRELNSSKELTVAETYALLKFLESETHDEARPI